jgi:beta-phosphoglucomutase-like phosphatase (HAD superfamily)
VALQNTMEGRRDCRAPLIALTMNPPERTDVDLPEAAVFDFDGLLVDSAACWHRAYADLVAEHGRVLDGRLRAELAGASVQAAAARLGLPASDLRKRLFWVFEDSPPAWLPGACELIGLLSGRVGLAIATNGPADVVKAVLRAKGLHSSFEAVLSAEEQARAKPAPDVYIAACQAVGVLPARAVAFEDSPVGVLAARRAGLSVVEVSRDGPRQPGVALHVPRLDDPRVWKLLGLSTPG